MSVTRHTAWNLLGFIIPAALSLLTVPLYLNLIGVTRYGAWVLIWTILSYFAVIDNGLPRAVAHRIAADPKGTESRSIFWTAFWINSVLALTAASALYLVGEPLIGHFHPTTDNLTRELTEALPWMAAWLPVNALGIVALGVLEGKERFATINILQLTGYTCFQLLPIAAVFVFGPNLAIMLATAVLSRALFAILHLLTAMASLGFQRPDGIHSAHARSLTKYGAWSSLSGLMSPFMDSLDRILIGTALGAKSVALYSVPFGLTEKARILPDALQRSLFPRLSRNQSTPEAQRQTLNALRWLIVLMTLCLAPGMFALGPFLKLWVGPEMAATATPLAEIFWLGMWLTAPGVLARVLLQARGQPDLIAKLQMLELLPYAAAIWLALKQWGLTGAALVWVLRSLMESSILLGLAGLTGAALPPLISGFLIIIGAFTIAHWMTLSLPAAIGCALAFTAIAFLLMVLWCKDWHERLNLKPKIIRAR